jgi:hypothetical protein
MKSNIVGWIALGLLVGPMAAQAAPPFTQDTNRNAVRSLSVADCDGDRCLSLQAGETYDLKGDYQYAFLTLSETSASNGGFSQRYLSCPLERGLISVRQDAGSASLKTSVNAADCDTGGTLCDSDYNCEDWGYTGTISVSVAMSAPFGTVSETSHVQQRDGADTYSGTCKRNAGYSYSNVSVAIDGEPWSPESSGAGDEYCNRNNRDR